MKHTSGVVAPFNYVVGIVHCNVIRGCACAVERLERGCEVDHVVHLLIFRVGLIYRQSTVRHIYVLTVMRINNQNGTRHIQVQVDYLLQQFRHVYSLVNCLEARSVQRLQLLG